MYKAIATVSKTKEIMDKYGLHTKKRYGQNFLIEPSIVERIAKSIPQADKLLVVEIGPGIGALTQQLSKVATKVLAYEIDNELIPVLADTLSDCDNVEIRNQDFLTVNLYQEFENWIKEGYEIAVAANLPYYITTPILFHLFESGIGIRDITVMMQKEVADRFLAEVSTKDYNALSVITQYRANTKMVMKVPKEVFIPRPKVESKVIRFTLVDLDTRIKVQDKFFELVKTCFEQRRKTIVNNLSLLFPKEQAQEHLEQANILPNRRAETCSLEEFIKLYEVIYHD
jgi:dimethyladenosine transferase